MSVGVIGAKDDGVALVGVMRTGVDVVPTFGQVVGAAGRCASVTVEVLGPRVSGDGVTFSCLCVGCPRQHHEQRHGRPHEVVFDDRYFFHFMILFMLLLSVCRAVTLWQPLVRVRVSPDCAALVEGYYSIVPSGRGLSPEKRTGKSREIID